MRFWRTGGELENVCSLLPQTPAVQDLSIILLKVIKLQRVGGVQQPTDRKWHHRLSQFCSLKLLPQFSPLVHIMLLTLPWICVTLVAIAIIRGGLAPWVVF